MATPRSDLIAALVAEEFGLKLESVASSTYISLGGDSLAAMRTTARIRDELGLKIRVTDLLGAPNWEALAASAQAVSAETAQSVNDQPSPSIHEPVPATQQQQIILYEHQLHPESTAYHFHSVIEFTTTPSIHKLQAQLETLVEKFPLLAAGFSDHSGTWKMIPGVASRPMVEVVYTDEPIGSATLPTTTGAGRPFLIGNESLIRWTLARRLDGTAALVHTEHHLIHDGSSFTLLIEQLNDQQAPIAPPYTQYALDQSRSSVRALRVATAQKMVERLPLDICALRAIGVKDSDEPRVRHLRLPIPKSTAAAIRGASQRLGITQFAVLLGSFAESIRSLWEPDGPFVLGVATSNRSPEYHQTVGMFVTTAPIVMDARAGVDHFAGAAKSLSLGIENSDFDIDHYARQTRAQGLDLDAAVPNVAFSMHRQPRSQIDLAGDTGTVTVGAWNGSSKFGLNVIVVEHIDTGEYELLVEHETQFIGESQVWALWTRFVRALEPHLLGRARDRGPSHALPADYRTRIALKDQINEFTFDELIRRAPALRRIIGSSQSVPVGIFGPASAAYFAAQYVVHKAGHTFVPLSTNTSVSQIQEMIAIARCEHVIVVGDAMTPEFLLGLPNDIATITWESIDPTSTDLDSDIPVALDAYILFTSGSSGKPKGVRVATRSLYALAEWAAERQAITPGTTCSQIADVGFDASILETWPALIAGATVFVVDEVTRRDPVALQDAIVNHRIEVAFAPTPIAELLLGAEWPHSSLRVLSTGGDRLHPISREQPFRVLNMYGPTEATIVATSTYVAAGPDTPSIGHPAPYAYIRIVDEHGAPVTAHREGEIWIGGTGVVNNGYVDLPDEDATRFIPDPYSPTAALVYRSGDIGRQHSDGSLEFVGRRDRQAKISGVRVELGSVEANLLALENVQAVAVDVQSIRGAKKLHIYIASKATPNVVIDEAMVSLPHYLRGSSITVLGDIPLNRSGKFDIHALRNLTGAEIDESHRASSDRTAQLKIWDALVEYTSGSTGSWFARGGTSLGAAQFVSWAAAELGIHIRLGELIEARDAAEYLAEIAQPPNSNASGRELLSSIRGQVADLPLRQRLQLISEISTDLRDALDSGDDLGTTPN